MYPRQESGPLQRGIPGRQGYRRYLSESCQGDGKRDRNIEPDAFQKAKEKEVQAGHVYSRALATAIHKEETLRQETIRYAMETGKPMKEALEEKGAESMQQSQIQAIKNEYAKKPKRTLQTSSIRHGRKPTTVTAMKGYLRSEGQRQSTREIRGKTVLHARESPASAGQTR